MMLQVQTFSKKNFLYNKTKYNSMIEAMKKYKNIINNKIDNAILNEDKATI